MILSDATNKHHKTSSTPHKKAGGSAKSLTKWQLQNHKILPSLLKIHTTEEQNTHTKTPTRKSTKKKLRSTAPTPQNR
jgi:hypothetical protein